MLIDVEVVHLDGPALSIDAQDLLARHCQVGAQNIPLVFVPMVPLTDEDTDRKRLGGERALERAHQVGPLPLAHSGQLHALIPLMPERLGPLGELLVALLSIRLDRTHHMPTLSVTTFKQAIDGIPTVEQHIDLDSTRQQLLQLRQHLIGQCRVLAKAQP
jgi:hypothetical protein